MPVLMPAPTPGLPLLKLFSSVERHMAHWATAQPIVSNRKVKVSVKTLISIYDFKFTIYDWVPALKSEIVNCKFIDNKD